MRGDARPTFSKVICSPESACYNAAGRGLQSILGASKETVLCLKMWDEGGRFEVWNLRLMKVRIVLRGVNHRTPLCQASSLSQF
jgi:hypothetical protein